VHRIKNSFFLRAAGKFFETNFLAQIARHSFDSAAAV